MLVGSESNIALKMFSYYFSMKTCLQKAKSQARISYCQTISFECKYYKTQVQLSKNRNTDFFRPFL